MRLKLYPVQEIGSVRDDAGVLERPDVGEIGGIDLGPAGAPAADHALDLHSVPQHGGVGQQAQAARLVHNLFVAADAELAAVSCTPFLWTAICLTGDQHGGMQHE